jgi:hypothetical protein
VSSLVCLISDICNPGEWVTMENLHLQVCYGRKIYFCTDYAILKETKQYGHMLSS